MTALVQSVVRWHRAFTWPERLVIGLFVLTAVLNVVRAVRH